MPTFAYVARNQQGARVTGRVEALDTIALTARLSALGYTVTGITEDEGNSDIFDPGLLFQRVRPHDLIDFYLELGTMLKSGIALSTALNDLGKATPNRRLAASILDVARRVQRGDGLSSALREHRRVFSTLACDLIEAGETTGHLDEAFLGLATYLQRDVETADQVKTALRYPAIVFCAAIVVVATTITYVLPNFAVVFNRLDRDLPLPTRAILAMGAWFGQHGAGLLLFLGGVVLLALWAARQERVALFLDGVRLRLPAIGKLHRQLAIARFARILGLLLSSGVPLLQALASSARVTANRKLRGVIECAAEEVRRGAPISEALGRSGVFPLSVIRIIDVGEKTGDLDVLLQRLSEQYEQQIPYAVKRLTTVLEVVMIAGMGALVAFVAFAFLMPMAMVLEFV